MCSSLTQIVFGAVMIGAIGLTLGAAFSEKWVGIDKKDISSPMQIIPILCGNETEGCFAVWQRMKTHEKFVSICLIISLLLEITALVYNFVSSCSCCFKKYLLHPLPPLSFLIVLFLSTGLIVFYSNTEAVQQDFKKMSPYSFSTILQKIGMGSAFWMGVGALFLAVADTIIASIALFFAEHGV